MNPIRPIHRNILLLAIALAILAPSCGRDTYSGPRTGMAVSADDVPVHFTSYGEGAGKPALLFVHGWSCDQTYWRHQIPYFSKEYRVVTLDLGGHGRSGRGRAEWTVEAFAADVAAVMEELDLRDAVLVGHSIGGAILIETYRRVPERIRALVGVDTYQDLGVVYAREHVEAFLERMRTDFQGTVPEFARSMFSPLADSALVAEVAADMASARPEIAIAVVERTLGWYGEEARAKIAEVAVPIRSVNGDLYPTNIEGNRAIARDYDAVVVAGSGHFPMLEQPAAFNEALAGVVRDLEREARDRAGSEEL